MTLPKIKYKTTRIFQFVGCSLLIFIAFFHLSGINFIIPIVENSNLEPFLKDIIPVLFVHPSFHLFALGALGIFSIFLKHNGAKFMLALSILALIDALFALYLMALMPAAILTLASIFLGSTLFTDYSKN